MPVDVSSSIVIQRPAEIVSAFACDPDNVPAWYTNIEHVEWKSPKPLRLGTRVAFAAEFLGRRLEYIYEIVEFVPGRRLVMRTAQGPFPMETSYTFEAISADRTRMTLQNRGEPSGFSKVAAPVMALAIRRANRKDLAALKRVLETGASPERGDEG